MNAEKYLKRIGLGGATVTADVDGLNLLQKNHLLRVPFENLDIHWKRPIGLDTEKFFDKIVGEWRGGFCYELNGLFAKLLEELGFNVKLVSARVASSDGNFGPEFDHLALLVEFGDETFLADVGFGDFASSPLKLELNLKQADQNGVFMIRKAFDDYFEVVKKAGEDWEICYIFTNEPRTLSEFADMCEFHQTSPDSHFTRGGLCSQTTENGRKTLTDKKFIVTTDDRKTETDVDSENEFCEILLREFAIAAPIRE